MTVSISNAGPVLSETDVQAIEGEIGAALPSRYRDFLLTYNGGEPSPSLVDVAGWPDSPTDVRYFLGIGRARAEQDIYEALALMRDGYPADRVLPIAVDSYSDIFCLDCDGTQRWPVVLYEWGAAFQVGTHRPLRVADDFESFLSMLYDEDLSEP